MAIKTSNETQTRTVKISTDIFSLEIDLAVGMIANFIMFGSPKTQWNDVYADQLVYRNRAGISVRDHLAETVYRDPFGLTRVFYHEWRKLVNLGSGSNPRCGKASVQESAEWVRITFDKTFPGAPFLCRNEITVFPDQLEWKLIFSLQPGEAERSLTVEYGLPFFREINGGYFPAGWQAWAPLQDAPYVFGFSGGWGHANASWYVHKFPYCSVNAGAGIGLPLIDVYNQTDDSGLALAAPPDLIKPELVFSVDKENSQLKLSYGNIGLRRGKEWKTGLLLFPHRGDWRVGLGWFHRKYQAYFKPNHPAVTEQEGTMFYGPPAVSEKTLKSWVKTMKVKWSEILPHRIFGEYAGSPDQWDFDMLWHPQDAPQRVLKGLTRQKIKNYLKMLKRNGVASFLYFNFGECDTELAQKKYSESIVAYAHCIRREWMFRDRVRGNLGMNPDSRLAWGREMLRQVEEIFDVYEDLDGLFIDQLCYHSYDYSRDDGETMVENRAVFDTHRASLEMMEKIGAILKRRHKTSFANGPYNIEIMKYADGIMSEGSLACLAKYSFMCLEKPVMILTYNLFDEGFERVLKACLKYGAFPSTPWPLQFAPEPPARPPAKTLALYRQYLPLIEHLRGRQWVLTSNPVEFPIGLDGNIFRRPDGGYVLPFFRTEAFICDRQWNRENPKIIRVKLPNIGPKQKMRLLTADGKGEKQLVFSQDAAGCFIEIPFKITAAVLLFQPE
jgi:hypothetical protein